ncbi:fibroblast growth factor 8b-like [Stegodyphus dumicola]|uniref:fibroblast growth factor 8b-like n=1 Tax=Stegodyphus dumicola TaxID=202533 RepID=UPI0015B2ECCA|nr:fibroblast growth factor 8b-like [Stegodyphus dumicola]
MLIFRFLQIASLAYLCSLFFKMVSCNRLPVDLEKEAPTYLADSRIQRTYKLYNQCSSKHVQIVGKVINAKGQSSSANVNLSFISAPDKNHPNAIQIIGQKSGRYVCFNKKGKLIARFNGKKRLCMFEENFSEDHYTVLQSIFNKDWYVGFNRKGKPLKGNLHKTKKKCYHFIKRDHPYGLKDPMGPGPRIKDPSKLKDLLTGRGHTPLRHRKIVPRTPTR